MVGFIGGVWIFSCVFVLRMKWWNRFSMFLCWLVSVGRCSVMFDSW